jgi:NADH:ubiquinone oxidoreductase subunit E
MEEKLQHIVENYRREKGTLIGLLQDMQETFGYLPEEKLEEVSKELDVPLSRLFSLATFYTTFRLEPMGKHHVCVCVGTACHVRGAPIIVDTIERELDTKAGKTTKDGKFTVDTVNCVGACALAPLLMIDGEHYGKMTQNKTKRLLKNHGEKKE